MSPGRSGELAAGAGPLGATFRDTCPSWLPHPCSCCGLSGDIATSLSHKSASQGRLLGAPGLRLFVILTNVLQLGGDPIRKAA